MRGEGRRNGEKEVEKGRGRREGGGGRRKHRRRKKRRRGEREGEGKEEEEGGGAREEEGQLCLRLTSTSFSLAGVFSFCCKVASLTAALGAVESPVSALPPVALSFRPSPVVSDSSPVSRCDTALSSHPGPRRAVLSGAGLVPGMAEAGPACSFFSQRGLQSRSPEAMCGMSDPESLDVTVLSEDEACSADASVRYSLRWGGLSESRQPTPSSSTLRSSAILVGSSRSLPCGAGRPGGGGFWGPLVTSKAPSCVSSSGDLSHGAWAELLTREL